MKIVEITWVDIEFSGGWHDQDEADNFITENKNRKITQIGYLYEEDENQLVLIDSFTGDAYGTIHVFPKGCIEKMTTIKE